MPRDTKKPVRPPKKIILGVRVTEATRDQIEAAAIADNRSMSQWVEVAILAALARKK